MNTENINAPLLDFFKALADANRLKIVGLLAQKEHTVEELAALLDLRASTVSHHLSRLSKIGLVSARAEGHYSYYRLEAAQLEGMARQILSRETLQAAAGSVNTDAYTQKVLKAFVGPDGMIRAFPSQRKKFLVLLDYVMQAFEPDTRYSEKEVNERLSRYNVDTALLRRELVETGRMAREGGGGDYWLTGTPPTE